MAINSRPMKSRTKSYPAAMHIIPDDGEEYKGVELSVIFALDLKVADGNEDGYRGSYEKKIVEVNGKGIEDDGCRKNPRRGRPLAGKRFSIPRVA